MKVSKFLKNSKKLENRFQNFIKHLNRLFKSYPILFSLIGSVILLISTTLLVLAIANLEWFELKSKNELGDAFGGLTNPVIAFFGVIVTFLAFYIQYKANKQQREMFNESLMNERIRINVLEEKELKVKVDDYKTHKDVFKQLGLQLINQYKLSGKSISDYCDAEKKNPYKINSIKHNISQEYEYFKKIDFITLHKSISYFTDHDKDWQKKFMNAISIIEYYQAYINGITNSVREKNTEKKEKLTLLLENFKTIYSIQQSKYSFLVEKELKGFENEDYTSANFSTLSKKFLDPAIDNFTNSFEKFKDEEKFIELHKFLLGYRTDLDGIFVTSDIFVKNCVKKHDRYFVEKKLLDKVQEYFNKLN